MGLLEEMDALDRQLLLESVEEWRKDAQYWRGKARTHEEDLAIAHENRREATQILKESEDRVDELYNKLAAAESQLRDLSARDLLTELEEAYEEQKRTQRLLDQVAARHDQLLDEYRSAAAKIEAQAKRIRALESFVQVIRMYPSAEFPDLRVAVCDALLGKNQ